MAGLPAPGASPADLLREHALQLLLAAVEAADPARAVRAVLSVEGGQPRLGGRELPSRVRRVRVVAFGKAACAMAEAAQEVLPASLFPGPGVAVTSRGSGRPLSRFQVREAGHPLPDLQGVEGARAVVAALRGALPDELALVLISGGGSALLPAPAPGITLVDKAACTRLLLEAGADIRELNTVRKHLSSMKGGGLARLAQPALVRALILSDVLGDDLSVIASGPVSPDPSTFAEATRVLERRGILERVSAAVRERLLAGSRGEVEETPKPGDPLFRRVECLVVGSNAQSLAAARARAAALGYEAEARPEPLSGEAREAAAVFLEWARRSRAASPGPAAALLAGGETTVTVRGRGRGGRNQEMALAFALAMEPLPPTFPWAFLSAGTDGVDGPTDAAGGLVDAGTLGRMRRAGVDPRAALAANDSYTALEAASDLVRTGPTGTNVADLTLLLLGTVPGPSPGSPSESR